MNHAIAPGSVPPPRGLEKEEPELAQEDDIPADDGTEEPPAAPPVNETAVRDVDRE